MGAEVEVSERARAVAEDYQRMYGADLVSVIVYGSALTPDYVPGKSDLNLLVVLSADGIHNLNLAHALVAKWGKKRVGTPLFLTRAYIDSSLDTFPIEFLNIKRNYRVIQGEDVLADLSFERKFVRTQCEREIKGKLLLLRKRYVETGGKGRVLKDLIAASVPTFIFIFKALLFLLDEEVPATKLNTISVLARRIGLDQGLFQDLLAISEGTLKPEAKELDERFKKYVMEIDRLALLMDSKEFLTGNIS
jgi:predicted nucleotidyltransferase